MESKNDHDGSWEQQGNWAALVVALICLLSLSACKIEAPPDQGPPKGRVYVPTAVTLEVQGQTRPYRLNELVVKGKVTSQEPIELWLCQGKPLTSLNLQSKRNTTFSWNLLDPVFTAKSSDFSIPDLVDEKRKITEFEWEFRAEDMSCTQRTRLEAVFETEMQVRVNLPATDPNSPKGYTTHGAEITIPALGG